jgi:hypothetical protein
MDNLRAQYSVINFHRCPTKSRIILALTTIGWKNSARIDWRGSRIPQRKEP